MFFHSTEKEVNLTEFGLGKNKKFRGLIDILKSYHFTIDENNPVDEEIALDPELLGHIFENLLASYNPETATTARKASGSYYTPREIVDYMVSESLYYYFLKECPDIDKDKLKKILSYSEEVENLSESEIKKLIDAIFKIKVLDPACGSGAFPMGVLQKLVFILFKIDPENQYWKQRIISKFFQKNEQASPNNNQKHKRKNIFVETKEIFENNSDDYFRKLFLIENCIYGVDIQNIAIQISKLRFFISLFIEQPIDRTRYNYGLKPLPNLETKFVVPNTLIGLEKPQQASFRNPKIEKLENELKVLRLRYFTIQSRDEKKKIQKEDKSIREKIAELLIKDGWGDVNAKKIADFDPYNQNSSADWFDPEWMFGVKDGFDIVIGNPPYVSTKGVTDKDKKILEKQFGFADDLYNHFYFKGIQLLNENGILTYISSKTFWTIQTKKNLRELLLKNKLLQLVDTANPFENAMVDTCITIVQKTNPSNYKVNNNQCSDNKVVVSESNHEISFIDISNGWDKKQEFKVKNSVYLNTVNNIFFKPDNFNMKIYENIGKKVKPLMEQWWNKISTSKNIEKFKKELEKYRNSLKPGDITLLGLITEGGQGLATANNGKYIGVLEGTKWAKKVREERSQKLWEFIQSKNPKELTKLKSKADVQQFLINLSEQEIRILFDDLKEKYGRDIFGQGWLYRIVSTEEIADVEGLTEEEKLNGIKGKKTFVPYDKGDKDGNRWWAPTPYYIDWSRENVKILQTDPKARWQGYQFYFREGVCWTDVSYEIRCRIKEKSIHDVLSMSLFSKFPKVNEKLIICLLNSEFMSKYLNAFVNTTVHFQINDARQLPIIIPTPEQLKEFEDIFDRAVSVQKQKFAKQISEKEAEEKLNEIQWELDERVMELYGVK